MGGHKASLGASLWVPNMGQEVVLGLHFLSIRAGMGVAHLHQNGGRNNGGKRGKLDGIFALLILS